MSTQPNALPNYSLVKAAFETLSDWVNRYRNRKGPSGLGECDPQEIARIAREMKITPEELCDLAKARPRSADLLQEMLPVFGIDAKTLASAEPLVTRDLQRLCATCRNKKRCREELDEFSAAENFREYCSNAVTIEALVKERSS